MSNCCYPPTTGDLCRDCALAEVVRLQKRCTSAELERNSLKASHEVLRRALAWVKVDAIACSESNPKQWFISDHVMNKVIRALASQEAEDTETKPVK